jgi:hypothetical protein
MVRIAAYQAPLLAPGSMEALDLIRGSIAANRRAWTSSDRSTGLRTRSVDPDGIVLGSARPLEPDLVTADLQQLRRQKQR